MNDDELDNVVGGYRSEFEDICKALGKSPTFNTRNGIRELLAKEYGIECVHWHTGDRGSSDDAPAEFKIMRKSISAIDSNGNIHQYNSGDKIGSADVLSIIRSNI